MHKLNDTYRNVGRRGPLHTKKRFANVTIRELAYWHPNSVYASLLSTANWMSQLDISPQAKRLSRLQGRQFVAAVDVILS
ncbi:MAG: hypothetical protein WC052_04855 [Patescibacteria group bacterium]|jgi:hypothetical protein